MSHTLLLIEDEDDIREVAQACLELTRGWTVHAANNGIAGLSIALDVLPEAILLDVMMPDLDGPGTLAELKKNPATASIPVIFLTAKVQSAERAKYVDLGAVGVLAKPFDPMALGDDVAKLLGWSD